MRSGTGVIVGRFQTPYLHKAHEALFKAAAANHEHVLVFVGVTPLAPTKRNPFDFACQEAFLREAECMCQARLTVIPLPDNRDDAVWVAELDRRITEAAPRSEITVYGGRDSFLATYAAFSRRGSYHVHAIEEVAEQSSTELRKQAGGMVGRCAAFRHGVIYGLQQQYNSGIPCADVAIFDEQNKSFLFGQKAGEDTWRFVGGHFDPYLDGSLEDTALREAREETGLELHSPVYVSSFRVEDWRYQREKNQIVTALYIAISGFGAAMPADDLAQVQWVPADHLTSLRVVPEHQPLLRALIAHPFTVLAIEDRKHMGEL